MAVFDQGAYDCEVFECLVDVRQSCAVRRWHTVVLLYRQTQKMRFIQFVFTIDLFVAEKFSAPDACNRNVISTHCSGVNEVDLYADCG